MLDETISYSPISNESDNSKDCRLADILDRYLQDIEQGNSVDVEQLVAAYPEYEQPLREYLKGLNLLNAEACHLSEFDIDCSETSKRIGDFVRLERIPSALTL